MELEQQSMEIEDTPKVVRETSKEEPMTDCEGKYQYYGGEAEALCSSCLGAKLNFGLQILHNQC
jgi:hypothetical protein